MVEGGGFVLQLVNVFWLDERVAMLNNDERTGESTTVGGNEDLSFGVLDTDADKLVDPIGSA